MKGKCALHGHGETAMDWMHPCASWRRIRAQQGPGAEVRRHLVGECSIRVRPLVQILDDAEFAAALQAPVAQDRTFGCLCGEKLSSTTCSFSPGQRARRALQ